MLRLYIYNTNFGSLFSVPCLMVKNQTCPKSFDLLSSRIQHIEFSSCLIASFIYCKHPWVISSLFWHRFCDSLWSHTLDSELEQEYSLLKMLAIPSFAMCDVASSPPHPSRPPHSDLNWWQTCLRALISQCISPAPLHVRNFKRRRRRRRRRNIRRFSKEKRNENKIATLYQTFEKVL